MGGHHQARPLFRKIPEPGNDTLTPFSVISGRVMP
ncbi:hypothetical protein KMAL_02280 [Novacetimonas maltaceti]|uniref:Uncharacterized protein n=1 Tax=Novacetimonas maltaceti TaxID=1203393 RepID=A0A2S3W5Z4_9PROT|nr:hypothetical protein KMAL_02280 [Novacetimonas maltaceti]